MCDMSGAMSRIWRCALFVALLAAPVGPATAQRDTRDTINSIGRRKAKPPSRKPPKTAPRRSTRAAAAPRRTSNSRAATRPVPKPSVGKQAALIPSVVTETKVWDLARDFSTTKNPNGAWTYGSTDDPHGPIEPFSEKDRIRREYRSDQLAGWSRPTGNLAPYVLKNVSASDWTYDGSAIGGGAASITAGQIALTPERGPAYAAATWRAARAGVYKLEASFTRFEQVQGKNSDYAVLLNGSELPDCAGLLVGYGTPESTATCRRDDLRLGAGDTITFAVGIGTDGSHAADGTVVDATIRATSFPASK